MLESTLEVRPFFDVMAYQDDGLKPSRTSRAETPPATRPAVRRGHGLVLDNVSFSYPGSAEHALKDVSLRIDPGEIVLVVGENGAGQTTFAKLTCRLYDPTAGRILWDGTDYRDIPLAELRRNISVVFQDHARFPTTLRENVAAGSVDVRDNHAAIVSALDKVGLGPPDRSPLGLDVPLTKELEGGIDLSGGQWQRLAIARALMRVAPGLVVLDEPTSAIDPQTEHEVLACLRGMAEGRSALVVSHRLGLASIAGTIVVLKEGRIVERGHHAGLMERRGLYREMFLRQASGYLAAANASVAHPPVDR